MVFKIKSPANIAFVKYWGQKDHQNTLPFNDSFSMNLSNCYTELEFEVLEDVLIREMEIREFKATEYKKATEAEMNKVLHFYTNAKEFLKVTHDIGFRIKSSNSFPKKAGIASSASFFSALALAFAHAFKKELSQKELSILARLSGSGSASRSIPDGFVWWHAGSDSESSFAESIATANEWDIVDMVLVLSGQEKKVSSADGHILATTSPYYVKRQEQLPTILDTIKTAFQNKDFTAFGTAVEQEAINFHSILMTQQPPLYFWSNKTIPCIKDIVNQRQNGLEGYFTIDAGENVHLLCQKKDITSFENYFKAQDYVEDIIINYACEGAKVV